MLAPMSDRYSGVIQVRERGVVTLPAELRRRMGLDRGDVHLEVVEREDGVIELRPSVVVPVGQAWFWSERWQRMEREADADFEAGRVVTAETLDELLSALED
jgi:AbrB family looped-hinge helix DNA binding protein